MEINNMICSDSLKKQGLEVARGIADWICNVQSPWVEGSSSPGCLPFSVDAFDNRVSAPSWNYSFASMGLVAAFKYFGEKRYKTAALRLGGVLKTFQILDPFHRRHYGAIRENSPLCPWCYTRDAISGAWGVLDLFRFTGDEEYLERAKLFGKWLVEMGLDEEGYPWFGVQLEPKFEPDSPEHIQNDIQGNFQGGSLNFFYQMYKVTRDETWVEYMKPIADIFTDYIQQPSGYFVSVFRNSKIPVKPDDPYAQLHRGNDDLGTLGLLCMYQVSKDEKYLNAVKKFLNAVWAAQRPDGLFEDSLAASPVILNATLQAGDLMEIKSFTQAKFESALMGIFGATSSGNLNPLMKGALIEKASNPYEVTMRANCYALIFLLKLFGGVKEYLSA